MPDPMTGDLWAHKRMLAYTLVIDSSHGTAVYITRLRTAFVARMYGFVPWPADRNRHLEEAIYRHLNWELISRVRQEPK